VSWLGDLTELGYVALAMLLGGLIGLDREFAHKPAGLRTHMLLSGACAILTAAGMDMVQTFSHVPSQQGWLRLDPILVVQAVGTAVGFIGAGTILHRDSEHVEGLTTAASLLLAAGVGVAVASGRLTLGIGGTVLALITLRVVRMLEGWVEGRRQRR
jgi:putative Mg2+ transporter-C (MgtC) family protein